MMRTIAILALTTTLATAAFGAADSWPEFRGPTAQGTSDATNVPVQWGANRNVAWKIAIPGRGWSSPVLRDGRLYLTTASGEGGAKVTLGVACFEAATGKTVWATEVLYPDGNTARTMHKKNTLASPTTIVTADRVYAHFGHMGTVALDMEGKVVWRQNVKYAPVHGGGGSPVLVGDSLIFSCDGAQQPFITALSAATGQVKWQTPRNGNARKTFSFCTPLAIDVEGKPQVIIPGSGLVAAYEPDTGREIWRVRYDEGYSVVPRPVYAHGLLFISTAFDAPVVYAIRPQGARGDVTKTHVAWQLRKGAPCTPSMIVVGDELYFVSDNGIATCADAKTGRTHWTQRLGGAAGFSASPVAAEGRVYFQNEAGMGFVIRAGKKFELLAENDLGTPSLASYAVADGALYIRTERHLWKIAAPAAE